MRALANAIDTAPTWAVALVLVALLAGFVAAERWSR